MKLDVRELASVPYLCAGAVGERHVQLESFWDGTEWHAWIAGPNGTLIHMRPRDLGVGSYIAKEPAADDDFCFPFTDFMWRRASWPDANHWHGAIVEDVHQLAASIAKIDFFWKMREHAPALVLGRFASSEIEYLLTVCRSVFDLLQEVIRTIWGRMRLLDEERQRRKGELRKSFADMVISKGELMSAGRITETRGVPLHLAETYAAGGAFFKLVRELRDGIVHNGKDAPMVVTTERGFIIRRDSAFAALPIWKDEHSFNEQAVSLRPALAYIVVTTLNTCNAFAEALGQMFGFPPDLAPGHRLFVRSPHGRALLEVQEVLRGGSPWWGPPAAL